MQIRSNLFDEVNFFHQSIAIALIIVFINGEKDPKGGGLLLHKKLTFSPECQFKSGKYHRNKNKSNKFTSLIFSNVAQNGNQHQERCVSEIVQSYDGFSGFFIVQISSI